MSQFFNSPEAVVSPECILLTAFEYIMDELIDVAADSAKLNIPVAYVTDDGEELMSELIKNSNHRLRMYGSARELADNLKIFRNTPGSSRYSDAHGYLLYPYCTTPVIYKSLNGDQEYICKNDAYLILQNMTLETYPFGNCDLLKNSDFGLSLNFLKPQVLRVLIAIFLRSQEVENLKNVEFAKFDQSVFDEIKEEIKAHLDDFSPPDPSEIIQLMPHLSNCTFPQLFEKFKSLIPIQWRDFDARFFEKVLARYVREFSVIPNYPKLLTTLYSATGKIIKILEKIINNQNEIFKNRNVSSTVRVFEDRCEQFVMKAELLEVICRLKKTKNSYKDKGMIIDTIGMEDVKKHYGDQIQDIEFIRCPILRAKHNAVPIQFGQEYCVLAVDAVFDFMKTVIFGAKLYQKYQTRDSKDESDGFRLMENGFDPNRKSKFFITINGIRELKAAFKMMSAIYEQFPANEVRNAKKDGFTVQNLKNELAHLRLTHAFPEIQKYADIVYSEVDKRKKEKVLRTCDLFDAVEQCELVCLFNRLPNFQRFLHNQKGCHRIYALKCERCELENQLKRAAEIRKTKENEKKKSSESSDSTITPESFMSSCEARIQKSAKPAESSAQKTADAPESKSSSETQRSQKTSANCDKCYRSCEMLNETKKELKSSENKVKNLEKKVSAKERELEESKQKQEEEKKNLNDQISNLKSSISQIEGENLRKEKTQKDLEDQVSRLEKSLEIQNRKMLDVNEAKMKLEENQKNLKEQVFQLEQELKEERKKTLESLKLSQNEKLEFEAQILEKTQKLEEFKELEIRMKAENEINQRMIQQLMDKLGSSGASYSNPSTSRIWKNSEGSTSSKMLKCQICWNELNDWESVKCHQCRRPFHIKCANSWLERYKTCPSCSGEFQDPPTRNQFSSFF